MNNKIGLGKRTKHKFNVNNFIRDKHLAIAEIATGLGYQLSDVAISAQYKW